ncbi:MAG: cupredoxin domain-containing protein [Pseudonocardia sp.]
MSVDTAARTRTADLALVAMAALTVTTLVTHLLLAGDPDPGYATLAVVPVAAAAALWTRRRWAPALVLVTAVLMVLPRTVELSFDLVRPGDLVPFVTAAVHVAAVGLAVSSALLMRVDTRRDPRPVALGAGLAIGAVVASGLLVLFPQGDGVAAGEPAVVDMVSFEYVPAQLRADAGSVALRFANDSGDSHSFTIDALGVDVQVPSGRDRVVVVDAAPGEYAVYCSVDDHRDQGMVGRLTVVGNGAPAAVAPVAAPTAGHHDHG